MSLITWSEAFSVGIKSIDEQHKKLVDLLNRIATAKVEGISKKEIEKILDELIDYTIYHFSYEEEKFSQIKYAREVLHKKEHEDLKKKILAYRVRLDEYRVGEAGVYDAFMDDLLNFIKKWLMNHILGEDKRYAKPMQDVGIQ